MARLACLPPLRDSVTEKITKVARQVYGADNVQLSEGQSACDVVFASFNGEEPQ